MVVGLRRLVFILSREDRRHEHDAAKNDAYQKTHTAASKLSLSFIACFVADSSSEVLVLCALRAGVAEYLKAPLIGLEIADAVTRFLSTSASAQAKILRAIKQHEVQPLGGTRPVTVNFCTIAATHHDLEQLVDEGKFRSDLFFRLHVAALKLPALRERPDDIPALARHFLRQIQ